MAPNTSQVASMNKPPKASNCGTASPRAGSTNCGSKARKNKATLGLLMFMMTPRRHSAIDDKASAC